GIAAYFGPGFTVIEAALLGLIVALAGFGVQERVLRRRAEARLEQGIHELSRLLSTDAKAGQLLSQRINALSDLDIGARLEVIEADVSVLGTVIRQVAEAVSDLEASRAAQETGPANAEAEPAARSPAPARAEPAVPLSMVQQTLDEERLTHHLLPIVTLPQRKTHGYTLVPRLVTRQDDVLDPPDFLPLPGGEGDMVIRRIERAGLEEAVRSEER